MLMFASVSALVSMAAAGGYGGYGGYGAPAPAPLLPATGFVGDFGGFRGFGGFAGPVAFGGAGPAFGLGPAALGRIGGCGGGFCGSRGGFALGGAQVVPAAVQTRHTVEFRDAPSGGVIHPTMVEVDAAPIPVNMLFRSASSLLNVQQAHLGSQGTVQETSSEDEPHLLRHQVVKPVIQEIREIVTPFRKINQEIRPVQEQIDTVVARGVGGVGSVGGIGGIGGIGGAVVNGGLAGSDGGIAFGNAGLRGSINNAFALGAPATFARGSGSVGPVFGAINGGAIVGGRGNGDY